MEVYVYRARLAPQLKVEPGQKFDLMIPVKDDFSKVPEDVMNALGELTFWKSFELTADSKLIALDSQEAFHEITTNGFYVAGSAVKFTVKTQGG